MARRLDREQCADAHGRQALPLRDARRALTRLAHLLPEPTHGEQHPLAFEVDV
jgi:hypothetical protein